MEPHPIRLYLGGELRRSRLTVFFRGLLALPHLVWYGLWGYAAQVILVVGWFAVLVTGRLPRWAHDFLSSYTRYGVHLMGYLTLAANPYPGFSGAEGSYPVDVEIPPPVAQSRWKTLFRLPLALPALLRGPRRLRPLGLLVLLPRIPHRRRSRLDRGLPRLVRCRSARANARRAPRPRRLCGRLLRAGERVRIAPHRPLPDERPRSDGPLLAPAGPPRRTRARGHGPPLPADRPLSLPAHPAALRLALPLARPGDPRRDRGLAVRPRPRPGAAAAPPLPGSFRPLRDARLRVSLPRRQPVPRIHGTPRPISGRARASGTRAAEPLEDGVSARPRVPGDRDRHRPRVGALPRGVPRLVRGARHRPDARRAPEPRGGRSALSRADVGVPRTPDEQLPVRLAGDGTLAAGIGRDGDAADRAASRERHGGSRALTRWVAITIAAAGWALAAILLWHSAVPGDLAEPSLDPERLFPAATLHRAETYEAFLRWDFVASQLVLLVVLALYAWKGVRFARESAAGRIGTGMLLGMIGLALVWLSQVPFRLAETWWDRRYDQSDAGYVETLFENWFALGAEFLFLCFALVIVMALAGRFPRRWWVGAGPAFVALAALFAFITPYLQATEPAPASLRADGRRFASAQGERPMPIRVQDVSAFTHAPNAFAAGFEGTRQVVLWSTLLDGRFSDDEVRVVVAHEIGHHSSNHILRGLAWYALFALPGAWLIAVGTRRRGGMGSARAVPFSLFVLVALQLLSTPFQSAISRHLEQEADWKALQTTSDPASARRLFEKFTTEALSDPDPPLWWTLVSGTHPSGLERIEFAEAWRRRPR